jgi:hypothetical protein
MNARDRGLRTANVITAALVATGVVGTVTVAAVVAAQQDTASAAASTTTSEDNSQSSVDVGSAGSSQQTHARSGGS